MVQRPTGARIANEILMHFRAQRKQAGEVSLSETLDSGDEDGGLSFMDVIAVEDDLLEELYQKQSCKKLRQCVEKCLEPREKEIVIQRYGLDNRTPKTQREIAKQHGISRSYVSRIEKRALEKLEAAMRE